MVALALPGTVLVSTALATDGWVGRAPSPPPPSARRTLPRSTSPPPCRPLTCAQTPPPRRLRPLHQRHCLCPSWRCRDDGRARGRRRPLPPPPPSRWPPPAAPPMAGPVAGQLLFGHAPAADGGGGAAGGRPPALFVGGRVPPACGLCLRRPVRPGCRRWGTRRRNRRRCRTAHTVWRSMLGGGYAPPGGATAAAGG